MDQKLWLKRQNMHKTNMLVKTSFNSEKVWKWKAYEWCVQAQLYRMDTGSGRFWPPVPPHR